MKIVGLYRENDEAGKPESDRALAFLVGEKLKEKDLEVEMLDGENAGHLKSHSPLLIFSMARKPTALEILEGFEQKGVRIINSPKAIRLCFNREKTYNLMKKNGLALPKTALVSLNAIPPNRFPFLLKKADMHGKRGDTFLVKNQADLSSAANALRESGRAQALFQEFVEGTPYKFYGIGKEIFLPDFSFDEKKTVEKIKEDCKKIASLVGMDVFGGDFIFSAQEKKAYVVDFNDWPSFSLMREEAATKIAGLLISKLGK